MIEYYKEDTLDRHITSYYKVVNEDVYIWDCINNRWLASLMTPDCIVRPIKQISYEEFVLEIL